MHTHHTTDGNLYAYLVHKFYNNKESRSLHSELLIVFTSAPTKHSLWPLVGVRAHGVPGRVSKSLPAQVFRARNCSDLDSSFFFNVMYIHVSTCRLPSVVQTVGAWLVCTHAPSWGCNFSHRVICTSTYVALLLL